MSAQAGPASILAAPDERTAPAVAEATGAIPARRSAAAALLWVTDRVAVVGADAESEVAFLARQLPPEPGVVTVIGQLCTAAEWELVTRAVPIAVPPGATARLAVTGAGAPPAPGAAPAPAALLAALLDGDVLAPVGEVLLVPGGSMFAAGGWLRFSGPAAPAPVGRRHPRPRWEVGLDAVIDELSIPAVAAGEVATGAAGGPAGDGVLLCLPIPAGAWVFPARADAAADRADFADLAYAIPPDADHPVLLVGRPDRAVPSRQDLVALADRLREDLRDGLVIVPYGPGADLCGWLARALADRWATTVTLTTGLPLLDADNRLVSVAVDPDGAGMWQPPVLRLRQPPGAPPRPAGPVDLFADLPSTGPGAHRLTERWVVEAVPAGLWVRPAFTGEHESVVRARPWHPRRLTVIVGLPGVAPGDDAVPLLSAVLARLPETVRERVEIEPAQLRAVLARGALGPRVEADLAMVADRIEPPSWWLPDARLFSVLLTVSRDGERIETDAGELAPGRLGELITGRAGWSGRPILLAAQTPIARQVCQLVADQTQVAVISPGAAPERWWAMRPRRCGFEPEQLPLAGPYPFADGELDRIVSPSRRSPPPRRTRPHGAGPEGGPLDLRHAGGATDPVPAGDLESPGPLVLVDRGPDQGRPFVVFGAPASVWTAATAIAEHRPEWTAGSVAIRLGIDGVDEVTAQLLANYLGAPVAVSSGREADWFSVAPRSPIVGSGRVGDG